MDSNTIALPPSVWGPIFWNTIHIVANGNLMKHYVNGTLMSEVLDEDAKNRRLSGLFGFQVHVGPPMKVMFKNILLKKG
jgi:hypothetical protein